MDTRLHPAILGAKAVILGGLLALAWMWWGEEPEAPKGPSDEVVARLDALERRLRSKSLIDVDAALGRLHARLDRIEQLLDAPASALPASGPLRPARAPIAEVEVSDEQRAERARAAVRARARAHVEVINRHVKGLTKTQLGEVETIFAEAHERETAAYTALRGQSNIGARFAPMREEILVERFERLQAILTEDQLRALIADVPLPIVPRSMQGSLVVPASDGGSGDAASGDGTGGDGSGGDGSEEGGDR